MKNELKVIDERKVFNKDFRIYGTIENPLFLAKDIAEMIDYDTSKVGQMLNKIDEDEKQTSPIYYSGQIRNMYFLTEDGMYEVLMQSRKPIAKKFKKEVKKILKTIRKTGGYVANADLMVNTYFGALDDTHKTIVKSLFENIENQQKQIIQLKDDNEILDKENDLLSGENLKWADRSLINALVRAYGSKLGNFGEAWTKFKKEILYKHSININARITNFMNSTGKKTKPRTLKMLHDEELSNAVSTIVALCRDNDVDISDIIKKYENKLNRKELVY
ncbi:BRO-N domain-containing protein [Clostridium haemolyticum]|uniref:Phage antirepressor protein n=1 Tax=Clostridium haemolyticum NCTC 9693 TaxID=1443114 RepID=A0ABR4TB75_CLOHA|nr:Bro-N domain-containing protein [Clostridium haemolyticum]KEI14173.1 putative phage antirepressor protein [Clostridium haemolyticum NCTC 9693]